MSKKGTYYIKLAEKNHLEVRAGKGDHKKVYAPDGSMLVVPCYNRDLSTGTECSIKKWFKALGILVVLGFLVLLLMGAV